MALDPIKNFDPITGAFRYDPQWQGPLSGRSFEQQTEDAINTLLGMIRSISGVATPYDDLPRVAGNASPGETLEYSRGDHVHPAQTDISGNAGSADQWSTPRTIELTGVVSGSAQVDGSEDVQIETTITDATESSAGLMSAADKIKLNGLDGSEYVHLTGNESISGAKSFTQGPYGAGAVVSNATINLANGVVFTATISANTTFAITGAPAGKAATFNLILTNGGSYSITWPASIVWTDETPPDLTPIGEDVLTFLTYDGGTHWYGVVALSGLPDSGGQTTDYLRVSDLLSNAEIDSLFT